MYYNGKFKQTLSIIISSENHDLCLEIAKPIKKQCEAWSFCVIFKEHKSTRKGPVLIRELMISQKSYGDDIIIFKEAIRRICFHYNQFQNSDVKIIDKGSIPIDEK